MIVLSLSAALPASAPETRRSFRTRLRRAAAVRFGAVIASAALFAGGLVVLAAPSPAAAVPGAVTGEVFRDFNSNGVKDAGPAPAGRATDVGMPGVTVSAYLAADSTPVATATTDAAGEYQLDLPGLDAGTPVRVEFDTPAGFESSFAGAGNGTSVQFAVVGEEGVDFAVNVPGQHTQDNAPLVTAIQSAGRHVVNGVPRVEPALVAIPYSAGFTYPAVQANGVYPDRTTLATFGQVGSIWGTTFSSRNNALFVAASVKRQSGFGPLGIGGIYRIGDVLSGDVLGTPGAPTEWFNVQGASVVGGGTVDLGTPQSDADRGLGGPMQQARDVYGFQESGKQGIGGISLSEDGSTLFFVNLNDRNVYAVDVDSVDSGSPRIERIELGLVAAERPWALTWHDGALYVGSVDTGESIAGRSAQAAGMHAHLYRVDPATGVRSGDLLNASLGYARDSVASSGTPTGTTAQIAALARWNSWTDTWTWDGGGGVDVSWWGKPAQIYPQPILSGLAFDVDGYVTLAFSDRTSVQGGNWNHSTVNGDGASYQTVASGDIRLAAPAADGTFVIESNGSVPGRTGANSREFYNDTQNRGQDTAHLEIALGAVTAIPGIREVAATSFDPLEDVRLSGLSWFNGTTGANIRGYQHTFDPGDQMSADGSFQKGGGLGDIEALAALAPLQIGNRVWFDADRDGLQGADEPPIAGVTVRLLDAAGDELAVTTTNSAGEYYFSSATIDGFEPNGGDYTVEVVRPSSGAVSISDSRFGPIDWAQTSFTVPTVGTTTGSDAIVDPSDPTLGHIAYTAGGPGENDHTLDAGIIADGDLRLVKEISTAGAPAEPGATFDLTLSAVDFRGDPIALGTEAVQTVGVGASAAAVVTLPVGSVVTVGEDADAGVVRSHTIDPTLPVRIDGAGASARVVTVTNTLREPGTFTVAKTVTGDGASRVDDDQSFTVQYTHDGLAGVWLDLPVVRGASVTSPELPYGTVVTLREVQPAVTDVTWGTPVWTVNGVAQTAAQHTITIGDGSDVSVGLENPATVQRGGFSVTKSVTGDAAGSVANDTEFPVTYSYVDTAGATITQTLTLTKAGASATGTVTGVPAGTVVTLTEGAPGSTPADVQWGAPVFSGPGVTSAGARSATFTVGTTSTVAVQLENPTTRLYADLSVTKSVTGAAAQAVADTTEFTIDYSWIENGAPQTASVTLTKGVPTAQLTGVPLGATLTLTERARPDAGASVAWQTPVWSGTGVTDDGAGVGTVTVGATGPISIGLENPTTLVTGGFTLAKSVTGDAAASVPAGLEFTIEYSTDGTTWTPVTVTKADANATVTGIPAGTQVTVREVTPTGAPADVSWGAPVWSGTGVTTSADGTATFTVSDQTVAVALENPTTRLFGGFSVVKTVTGEAADTLDDGFEFTVAYTHAGGSGTLQLVDGQTWTLPTDRLLPAGTVVTLSEVTPLGGLPDLSGWGAPVFSVGGTASGVTATITIGADSTTAVMLENPTTVTPQVSISKGDGHGTTIVNEADTMAAGQFYRSGETRTIVFHVENSGTERLRDVVLRDQTIAGAVVDSLVWTLPDGSTLPATLDGDTWTAPWAATFDGTTTWLPGEIITGTATLTLEAAGEPHVDRASVTAVGAASGTPVDDTNDYNAFSAAIQVIKYDGHTDDPAVRDADGRWIVPTKPLLSPAADANTAADAVVVDADEPHTVRWVVTNTGHTHLTQVRVTDVTERGPDIGAWTCDLSPLGGPAAHDFVADGPWSGLFAPGTSFFCEGPLTLAAGDTHRDTVTVVADVVVPEVDADGVPTGEPSLDGDDPVVALNDDGTPVTVTDDDPFEARAEAETPPLPVTGVDGERMLAVVAAAFGAILLGLMLLRPLRRRA